MESKKIIIIVLILLIGIGVWVLMGGEKGVEVENGVISENGVELSLTDIFGKAMGLTSYKYDMVVTAPDQAVITTKMWRKGKKMRMEGSFEGQSMVYLVDVEKNLAYTYFPSENMAMKIGLGKVQETAGESPTEQSESVMKYNPVTVGTEVLDGKTCTVVEYTTETDNVKMWIWAKYGLPIKTESTTAQGTTVIELKNIDLSSIPDSVFELPAGVEIMELPF